MNSKAQLNHPLVNQYSLTLGQDLGQHDTKSLIKCVETLSFIVRDAAHVTPDNFELCVRAIRVFVEASLNGGEKNGPKSKRLSDWLINNKSALSFCFMSIPSPGPRGFSPFFSFFVCLSSSSNLSYVFSFFHFFIYLTLCCLRPAVR